MTHKTHKKLFALLLLVLLGVCFPGVIITQAAYQKDILSEQIIMDSGRLNIVDWQEVGKDGDDGTWSAAESNPYVTNLSATGDMLVVEPYATADLSEGDVELSFEVLKCAAGQVGNEYGTHAYVVIEPADGSAASKISSGAATSYYALIKENILVADYSYYESTPDTIFYRDKKCTSAYDYTADFIGLNLALGEWKFTFTKDRVLGVTIGGVTVYIKDAFPAEYVSGEMRFGISEWGLFHFDNLKLVQKTVDESSVTPPVVTENEVTIMSTGFETGWNSAVAATGKLYAANFTEEGSGISSLATGADLTLETYDTADLSEGDVELTFNVTKIAAANEGTEYYSNIYAIIEPAAGSGSKIGAAGTTYYYAYLKQSLLIADYSYYVSKPETIFYRDKACTEAFTYTGDYISFGFSTGEWKFTFTEDRVLGVTANGFTVYIKDAFPAEYTSGEMKFGIYEWGKFGIDSFSLVQTQKVSEGGQPTVTETELTSTGFEDGWNDAEADGGKCLALQVKLIKSEYLVSTNTSAAHRMVIKNPVVLDDKSIKIFDAETTLKFTSLNNNFGFVFGLPEKDSAITDGSFIYFMLENGKSYLVFGTEKQELSVSLTSGEEIPVKFTGEKGGKLKVTVAEQQFNFTEVDFEGYFAVLGDGEGDTTASISKNFKFIKYTYKASEGGEIANNFNTGYVNSDYWVTQNDKALYLEDMSKANGMTYEDGKLNFDGTGMWAYYSTKNKYSDYIVEFDYIQPHECPASTQNGGYNGTFSLCIAANDWAGSLNSYMLSILYYPDINLVRLNDYSQKIYAGNYDFPLAGTGINCYNAEKDTTIAVKVVVANNEIKMYLQDITETEFAAANYVLVGEWDVYDTFGYVGFAASESNFQSFDNLRITPVDDPDPQVVLQNIANFVDRKPIADEYAFLSAPVITVKDNVVSWQAVKDAEGYVVTVNGEAKAVQTDLSYTVSGEPGEYTVTVKAVGTSSFISGDSEASNEVKVTLTDNENGNNGNGNGEGDGNQEDDGCKSGIGADFAVYFLILGCAVILIKRRYAKR